MPDIVTTRRFHRAPAGFTTARLPAHGDRPLRLFVPADYQPKYAYPLVVMLHAEGEDEDAAAHLAPRLSPRNYIAASPRGLRPVGNGLTGRPTFSWHAGDTRLTRYLLGVVAHARREYHIHPDRIYLLGIRDGAAVAGRAGAMLAGRIAGVIALNGVLPRRVDRTAGLRVFVGHGSLNPLSPVAAARKAALRWAATGAELLYHTYPATHAITDDMLRDVNRWIIDSISPDDTLSNPID